MNEHCDPDSMAQAVAWLDEANTLHDNAPDAALDLLRRIPPAALPPERRARFAFLMNHVAGEKLGRWDESLRALQAVVDAAGSEMDLPLWRHAAVAAHLAGDLDRLACWRESLAAAADASAGQAQALILLAAAGFVAPGQDAVRAGRDALQVLQPLASAPLSPGLDAAFAASANNLASHLVERPLDDLRHPDMRSALDLAAHLALQCWSRAGGWVQKERAHYLCALAANALGEGERAVAQARAGLALIDAHDADEAESVDRAFLELEQAQGLWLGGRDGATQAQERAQALAARFPEVGPRQEFAERVRRNEDLRRQYLQRKA